MAFTHLHIHTHYSSLDGACKVDELVKRAKELGHTSIAITDHGNMCGVYDLYKCCKAEGIAPIFGCEFYHTVEGVSKRLHLVCLAKSMKGLQNLYKLHELSHKNKIKGAFGKLYPVITYEDLFKYKEDIVISTACMGGHIPYMILEKEWNDVYVTLESLKKQFGDDLYLEVQSNNIPEQKIINEELIRLGKLYNIKCIATNDTHYILESDAKVHEMLLCMQTQDKMSNPKRFRFSVQDFWLKSEDEMYTDLHGIDHEDRVIVLNNTIEVANKCIFELELPKQEDVLPRYANDERKALRELCNKGWKEQKHDKGKREIDRTNFELDIIESKGYSGYYLIVSDYINWAKDNDIIVGGGRGSGVGSFIAYLTKMTTLNPIEHGLLFERFLNPERYTSPDFDVDFSDRESVVKYLQQRWGEPNVSNIIAFGKLTAKAVMHKILSIHDFKQQDIVKLTKSLPRKLNLELADCEQSELFQEYKKNYPELINAMYRLEGVIDHFTIHAAGVLITPKPISDFCPLMYDEKTNMPVVGFDKYMIEDLGLYKFDILTLTTLNVIDDTVKLIKTNHNVDIDFTDMKHDDANVYEDLCKGNVFGVFQLEDQPDMTVKLQPKNFSAITALNALIRPGVGDVDEYTARMNGKPYTYHSELETPYMQETYGTMTYQEQFMQRVHVLAGWSLGKGDSLRKVKHIRDNEELKEEYTNDCVKHGLSEQTAIDSWSEICDALEGGYTFNKSHASSYASISYQTAWLKHYYPLEFMCALLSNKANDKEIVAKRITQGRQINVQTLRPCVNRSEKYFTIEEGKLRFGLLSIDGIGHNPIQQICSLRPFTSLLDFLERTDKGLCDKTVVSNLINSGAFDDFNTDRYALFIEYFTFRKEKKILVSYTNKVYNLDIGLAMEKEALGFYLTSSPLEKYNFKELASYADGHKYAIIGGEIIKQKVITDKNKRPMAFVTVNTQYGAVEVVVFASTYAEYKDVLDEHLVMIKGKRDGSKLLANELIKLS